jgi:hypothetical protein
LQLIEIAQFQGIRRPQTYHSTHQQRTCRFKEQDNGAQIKGMLAYAAPAAASLGIRRRHGLNYLHRFAIE